MKRLTQPARTIQLRVKRASAGAVLAIATVAALGVACGCGGQSQKDLRDAGFDRNPVGVPPEAKMVRYQSGKGGGVLDPNSWFGSDNETFKPSSAGRAWVIDELNAKIVYQTKMNAGDELSISVKDNAIRLNKAFVYGRPLANDRGFIIYFAPEQTP